MRRSDVLHSVPGAGERSATVHDELQEGQSNHEGEARQGEQHVAQLVARAPLDTPQGRLGHRPVIRE